MIKAVKHNLELEKEDIEIGEELRVDDRDQNLIIAFLEPNFDVEKKFNLNINDGTSPQWINMYAKYNPFKDQLNIECTTEGAVKEYLFEYNPIGQEAQLIKQLIEKAIYERFDQTPIEFCISVY